MSVKIRGMDRLLNKLKEMGGDGPMLVKAGVLEGAKGYNNGASAALFAAVNEFGDEHTPPRPFMRHTFETCKEEWVKELAGRLAAGESPKKALELVGTLMEDDIKAAINEPASDWKPANSPATLKRKRKHSTIPLIDNSILLKAIAYEVET